MLDPIERIKLQQKKPQILESDTTTAGMVSLDNSIQTNQARMDAQLNAIRRAQETGEQGAETRWSDTPVSENMIPDYLGEGSTSDKSVMSTQNSIMGNRVGVNQAYGKRNPSVEVFSKDGINRGVDFNVKEGTPLALPPGTWQVLEAFGEAKGRGKIGDSTNRGYGNSVLVKNTQSGEMMRFSHLQAVMLQPGKTYSGGTVFGRSGATGNVTGPHLDLEYKDPMGNFQDVMRSVYANYLFNN